MRYQKMLYVQSMYNDNFDNGIFKGLFDSKKKLVK